MTSKLDGISHNPDILSCLANLSNDEIFTPPAVVNEMLDILPQDLFRDPETKFLDPACKSGVFLREIAKRLITGIADKIPNLQKRVDHILHKQLYGIAITELTSLISRRTLYCSKHPQGPFSVSAFNDAEGNIHYHDTQHTWKNGKCIWCGVSQEMKTYTREAMEVHAYEFIHKENIEEIFSMKFDVIIGNPPYQLNVGVEKENYAIPIYQKFVEQARKLNPRYLTMIIPARWYAGGRGLDKFRDEMLNSKRISELHDYPNSTDCFPSVDISGGICYFLMRNSSSNRCKVVSHTKDTITSVLSRPLLEPGMSSFIRQNEAVSIFKKVRGKKEKTFDQIVSPQTPFGFVSSFRDFTEKPGKDAIKYYTYGYSGYVTPSQVKKGQSLIKPYKVFISKAYGERGPYPYFFLGKPFLGEKNSCCSQSYLVIGPFNSKEHAKNVMSYIRTRFFRFMVMLKKNSQDNMSYVFECVPLQDFSKPWTDQDLYDKYNLTKSEVSFIESMIKPMDEEG